MVLTVISIQFSLRGLRLFGCGNHGQENARADTGRTYQRAVQEPRWDKGVGVTLAAGMQEVRVLTQKGKVCHSGMGKQLTFPHLFIYVNITPYITLHFIHSKWMEDFKVWSGAHLCQV